MKDKSALLNAVGDDLLHLSQSPLYSFRIGNGNYPVLGEGNHNADIFFVGEAPGKNEAKTGKPFCGRSGKILDELLFSVGLLRETVYITNIVKDRPPENRDPSEAEIEVYGPLLDRQVEIIKPKVIVTLGRFSANYIGRLLAVGDVGPISEIHGHVFEGRTSYGTIHFVALYHPAAAIYNQALKATLATDFEVLKQYIS